MNQRNIRLLRVDYVNLLIGTNKEAQTKKLYYSFGENE